MNKSENINELAQALSLFQGEVIDASKDRKGFNYKYSDLSQILEIARPLMCKHGLSVSQFPGSAHDKVTVESVLMHKSGQWMSGTIEMSVQEQKGMSLAQAVGSVITYARRYSLTSIIGITQSDNDAAVTSVAIKKISPEQVANIEELTASDGKLRTLMCQWAAISKLEDMPNTKYEEAIKRIEAYKAKQSAEDINKTKEGN